MKTVIVINGKGSAGKDTICDIVGKHFKTLNVSAITPIKLAAIELGWKPYKRDDESRKFLSDIKQLSIQYNDYPTKYLVGQYKRFIGLKRDVMFVHIREPEEIDKFKKAVPSCFTLLIRNSRIKNTFGNISDDGVENYSYDFIYDNERPLDELESDFMKFFKEILEK